jgi:hypothetical protein
LPGHPETSASRVFEATNDASTWFQGLGVCGHQKNSGVLKQRIKSILKKGGVFGFAFNGFSSFHFLNVPWHSFVRRTSVPWHIGGGPHEGSSD